MLEGHSFERVGGSTPITVDVRVVAATNRDLELAIEEKIFRKDLYFRLFVVELTVPPLREHPTDVPLLAHYFLERFATKTGRPVRGFTDETMELLLKYNWPGNVRELQNCVERAVVLSTSELVTLSEIHLSGLRTPVAASVPPTTRAGLYPTKAEKSCSPPDGRGPAAPVARPPGSCPPAAGAQMRC